MRTIVPLTDNEKHIVERVTEAMRDHGTFDELAAIKKNELSLDDLARSISQYPSVFGQQQLGNASRSVQTLIDTLCIKDISDRVYHIPTKAILGQGFAVAKINFFFMLYYSLRQRDMLEDYTTMIMEVIKRNVYTSMAEEVFLAIISDKNIPLQVRSNAGYLLANIWEYRLDHGVKEFAPILNNIWNSRKKLRPAYGTMLGVSELFLLSRESGNIWMEFFQRDDLKHEEIDSLQEFIMGLSFEEMETLAREMERTGKSTYCIEEIRDFLGGSRMYEEYNLDDPREIFRSYKQRKRNADFRKRANLEGPKKTIEEYLMIYLLARPEMDEELAGQRWRSEP